ncbi:MAG TPA: hypothetical protein VM142_13235 [Acidimicrobiales bacterium]|nr:hypothetical protein [Acidimicrobiales bacterium]
MRERRITTGPRVPGWHPDPDDGDYLRHWNGRKWGSERRPRPAWAGESRDNGEPAGPPPVRPPRRWLVGGAVVVALVFFVLFAVNLSRGPEIPPRNVDDAAFTRRAESACRRVLPKLQAQRPQLGEKPKDEAELVASKVELTANGLEGLVTQLRALPVAAADEPRVDRWLDDWDTYIAVGRRYTADLRRGEDDAPARAARDGDPLTRRVYLFSRSNGMPSCVL